TCFILSPWLPRFLPQLSVLESSVFHRVPVVSIFACHLLRLRLSRRLIRPLQTSLGGCLDLRQSSGRIQRRLILLQRRLALLFHIQNSSQIHVRPSHHGRIFRRGDCLLKIILRSIPILIRHSYFRQDKKRPPLVPDFSFERGLRQFLRTFAIARRQPLLRRAQHSPLFRTRQPHQFRRSHLRKLNLRRRSLLFL